MDGIKEIENLIETALAVRENAYAPYSGFLVGAAVLWDSGNIYSGCNVENSSFGATNCAERTAIFTAAAKGEIKKGGKITKIAIAGGKKGENLDFCLPCGICLQVISEFTRNNKECEIILVKTEFNDDQHKIKDVLTYRLVDLLPKNFVFNTEKI